MLPESTGGCAPYVESTEGSQEARGRKRHRRALGEDVGPRLPLQSLPVQRGCTQGPATSVNASCLPGIILSCLISCVTWTTVCRHLVKIVAVAQSLSCVQIFAAYGLQPAGLPCASWHSELRPRVVQPVGCGVLLLHAPWLSLWYCPLKTPTQASLVQLLSHV